MEEQEIKKGFFRRMWYSITKLEKYPNMAAEGVPKALNYFAKLVFIFVIVFSLGLVYQTYKMINEGTKFLQNEFPEFSYKDDTFKLENDTQTGMYDTEIGKIIIDTNDKTEEEINQYINSIDNETSGIIILKDKLIIKNIAVSGSINYNYKDLSEQMNVKEFNKQDVINYVNSSQMVTLYVSIFGTILIYSFVLYFISMFMNVIMISLFGYLTALLARIKMRYAAIFNMSVYAITLSTLLEMLYLVINIFIDFTITYFQVAYVSIACIYLVAAIFIIKSEFIKKQAELTKIIEVQKEVKKEIKEDKEPDDKKPKEKEPEKKEPKNKEKKDNDTDEPAGSEA